MLMMEVSAARVRGRQREVRLDGPCESSLGQERDDSLGYTRQLKIGRSGKPGEY